MVIFGIKAAVNIYFFKLCFQNTIEILISHDISSASKSKFLQTFSKKKKKKKKIQIPKENIENYSGYIAIIWLETENATTTIYT